MEDILPGKRIAPTNIVHFSVRKLSQAIQAAIVLGKRPDIVYRNFLVNILLGQTQQTTLKIQRGCYVA